MAERNERVRVGVVGVGYFGRFHAQKFARHPRAALMGLADPDTARLVDVAAECGSEAYTDPQALIGAVEAVSIAAPARLHGPLAALFLRAGVHVLVEKPLAASLAEAEELVRLAQEKDLILQVGHQERAVLAAAGLFAIPEKPRAMACVRKGPFTGRGTDVDVILDLMSHDLDMMHALDGSALRQVEARGTRVRSEHIDQVEVRLTLGAGTVANLSASRVAEARERHIRIDYGSGHVAVDFLARTVENTTPHRLGDIFPAGEDQEGISGDPLGYALDRFLAAVRGEGPPLVSGTDSLFTLTAAARIAKAVQDA